MDKQYIQCQIAILDEVLFPCTKELEAVLSIHVDEEQLNELLVRSYNERENNQWQTDGTHLLLIASKKDEQFLVINGFISPWDQLGVVKLILNVRRENYDQVSEIVLKYHHEPGIFPTEINQESIQCPNLTREQIMQEEIKIKIQSLNKMKLRDYKWVLSNCKLLIQEDIHLPSSSKQKQIKQLQDIEQMLEAYVNSFDHLWIEP